jgi:hypothetical protein
MPRLLLNQQTAVLTAEFEGFFYDKELVQDGGDLAFLFHFGQGGIKRCHRNSLFQSRSICSRVADPDSLYT